MVGKYYEGIDIYWFMNEIFLCFFHFEYYDYIELANNKSFYWLGILGILDANMLSGMFTSFEMIMVANLHSTSVA